MREHDNEHVLDRLLRERLADFNVPLEIRNNLAKELMAFFARPERSKSGATVATPESSMAETRMREQKRSPLPGDDRPKVL